jgi:hypothetical protein
MEKFVIDLSNPKLLQERGLATSFGVAVRNMLMDMYTAGFNVPVGIRGTNKQIETFFRALKNEKRYMDSYMKHGLSDSRTMMNKRDLDRAVQGFEGETGLRWPFKN